MTYYLLDRYYVPFGRIIKYSEIKKFLVISIQTISIINIFEGPLQPKGDSDLEELRRKLRTSLARSGKLSTHHRNKDLNELKENVYGNFLNQFKKNLKIGATLIPKNCSKIFITSG